MNEALLENLNLIAFAIAVIVSAFAIITGRQRFFVGLAVAGIIASFALNLFTTALSGTIIKVCLFIIILMFAVKVFKKIAKQG